MASTTTNKILAVLGFLIAIVFLLWLAVKLVAFLPSAFSSLASIADSVQNYRPTEEIVLSTSNSVINADAPFVITWDEVTNPGTFTFTYDCDTQATLQTTLEGETVTLTCDEPVTLSNNDQVEVVATSDEQRFTDVTYTITFLPEQGKTVSATDTVTVVNAAIPAGGVAAVPDEEEETEPAEPAPSESPAPTTPPETYYRTVEEVTYSTPTSDPNGYVDLEVKFVAIGHFDNNQNFRRVTSLETDEPGALRFYVKNIGTKTSADWTFDAELPTGVTYESTRQAPLKPNEQSVLTIQFGDIDQSGLAHFTVDVATDKDIVSSNNQLDWAIAITN